MNVFQRIKVAIGYFGFGGDNVAYNCSYEHSCIVEKEKTDLEIEVMLTSIPIVIPHFEERLRELLVDATNHGLVITISNEPHPYAVDPATGKSNLGMGKYVSVARIRPSYPLVRFYMDKLDYLKKLKEAQQKVLAEQNEIAP